MYLRRADLSFGNAIVVELVLKALRPGLGDHSSLVLLVCRTCRAVEPRKSFMQSGIQ